MTLKKTKQNNNNNNNARRWTRQLAGLYVARVLDMTDNVHGD